jgi:hypothetical protein
LQARIGISAVLPYKISNYNGWVPTSEFISKKEYGEVLAAQKKEITKRKVADDECPVFDTDW